MFLFLEPEVHLFDLRKAKKREMITCKLLFAWEIEFSDKFGSVGLHFK